MGNSCAAYSPALYACPKVVGMNLVDQVVCLGMHIRPGAWARQWSAFKSKVDSRAKPWETHRVSQVALLLFNVHVA